MGGKPLGENSMLLMLEDNAERVERFRAVLQRIKPPLEFRWWRNAWRMIDEVEPFLPFVKIISLDHDLDPEDGTSSDPGSGWEVAKYLANMPPICPVIIHTSNKERANWMMGEFELGGWEHHRLPPLGDDWIEHDWRRLVCRLLKKKSG